MSRVEGHLIYFERPDGRLYDVDGNEKPVTPLFCSECGRRLVATRWGSGGTYYPILRCDGWIGSVPILRMLIRWTEFANGLHYTFQFPPMSSEEVDGPPPYDTMTGIRRERPW